MRTDPLRPFRKPAPNNALAGLRLLNACKALQPGAFAAPRLGFFPSSKAGPNHILTIGPPFTAQMNVKQRLMNVIAGLDAPEPAAPVHIHRVGRVQVERTDDVLMHLFMHQTHHRGQAHAMLSGTSVRPPQLDARFRAGELAAPGWREAELTG